jgi:hypothetical protein
VVEEEVCAVREERDSFFKNGTDAQDCCGPDNKRLVFGESLFDTIILEHCRFHSISLCPYCLYPSIILCRSSSKL